MGTKNNPGQFDCYANAKPNEPMFVLLARDERAPHLVREWVRIHRQERINKFLEGGEVGESPYSLTEKEQEAMDCSRAMEAYYKETHSG